MLAHPVLTTNDKASIRWMTPDFDLLRTNVPTGLRGTFALLEDGRYGPSYAPPRPYSSSSDSSGSCFGNRGTLSAKGGFPARLSSSGSGKGAPARQTAAPLRTTR